MKQPVQDAVRGWLDAAATAMGGGAQHRRDVLLELETTIYDRVDERTRRGQVPEEAVRDVLEILGDPAELGSSLAPVRPLIAPHQTRAFILHTVMVFAVHFLLVIGATVADRGLAVGPLRIHPIADAKHFLNLVTRAAGTLIFDAGAVLCLYALLPRLSRIVRFPRAATAVHTDARRSVESALFFGLLLVALNLFRDDLFALYVDTGHGVSQIPFAGHGIMANLLLLNLWLGVAMAKELFYARLGERRLTLALDLLTQALGVFALLRIAATQQLVDLTGAQEALSGADSIGALLNSVLVVLAMVGAAMLAGRGVRRCFRLFVLRP